MRRWTLLPLFLAAAAGVSLLGAPGRSAAQDKSGADGEAEEFPTADGMLLQGRFHKATKGNPGDSPVVIMMYAPGPDKDMTKNDWAGLANTLAKEGNNVFRFDWRGHGLSKKIADPNKFWDTPLKDQPAENPYTGPVHQNPRYVRGYNKLRLKQEISARDFLPAYNAEYAQDLAAVRVHLDQKNDRGAANTSRVILIGEGEAATIAMIWMAAEWMRHDTNVLKGGAILTPYNVVPLPRGILNLRPLESKAGSTIRGAIWLTPKLATGVAGLQLSQLFDPAKQPGMRQTPMLFMYGDKDATGKNTAVGYFFNKVVNAQPPKGGLLQPVKGTVVAEIKNTKLAGGALLGNTGGQAEDKIVKYINDILPTSKAESKPREFTSPYFIDLNYFGFNFR